MNKSSKIVIIGAGLAGLTAAYRLHQRGVDVAIYEARKRVGGRILSVKINDHIAELGGGNLTDGGEAKNLHRLIQEFAFELQGSQVSLNYSYFNGEQLIPLSELLRRKQFQPERLRHQLNALRLKSHNMQEVLLGILEKEDPLYKLSSVRLSAYEGAPVEKLSPFYVDTLFNMLLGGVSIAHPGKGDEQNLVNLLSLKEGNACLPEKLAEALGDKVHLNNPLKQVLKGTENTFLLIFADGSKVKADRLILTIPCSMYETIIFDKDVIPLEKLNAIKQVHYGTNAKIFVPFSHLPAKRTTLANDRILADFVHVNSDILTMYYTGEASRFSKETIVDTYRQDRVMIEKAFGDRCPLFIDPLFAEDKAFASYETPIGYSWTNDPYVKGSYAYISPGQESLLTTMHEEQGESVRTLFAPIDQKLYFAGEHTSVLTEVPGTMEAACESGERMARMILKSL